MNQNVGKVLSLLSHSPLDIEEIVSYTNLKIEIILQTLTFLMLEGKVQKVNGSCFVIIWSYRLVACILRGK